MTICRVCNRPLKDSQWNEDRTLKSCPKCSQENGKEHVFYSFPESFGTTDHRVTARNPEGAQSQCYACRERGTHGQATHCSEIE